MPPMTSSNASCGRAPASSCGEHRGAPLASLGYCVRLAATQYPSEASGAPRHTRVLCPSRRDTIPERSEWGTAADVSMRCQEPSLTGFREIATNTGFFWQNKGIMSLAETDQSDTNDISHKVQHKKLKQWIDEVAAVTK